MQKCADTHFHMFHVLHRWPDRDQLTSDHEVAILNNFRATLQMSLFFYFVEQLTHPNTHITLCNDISTISVLIRLMVLFNARHTFLFDDNKGIIFHNPRNLQWASAVRWYFLFSKGKPLFCGAGKYHFDLFCILYFSSWHGLLNT